MENKEKSAENTSNLGDKPQAATSTANKTDDETCANDPNGNKTETMTITATLTNSANIQIKERETFTVTVERKKVYDQYDGKKALPIRRSSRIAKKSGEADGAQSTFHAEVTNAAKAKVRKSGITYALLFCINTFAIKAYQFKL